MHMVYYFTIYSHQPGFVANIAANNHSFSARTTAYTKTMNRCYRIIIILMQQNVTECKNRSSHFILLVFIVFSNRVHIQRILICCCYFCIWPKNELQNRYCWLHFFLDFLIYVLYEKTSKTLYHTHNLVHTYIIILLLFQQLVLIALQKKEHRYV